MASGLLYERIGGHAFLIMAALCLLALPMCAALRLSACGGVREGLAGNHVRSTHRHPVRAEQSSAPKSAVADFLTDDGRCTWPFLIRWIDRNGILDGYGTTRNLGGDRTAKLR